MLSPKAAIKNTFFVAPWAVLIVNFFIRKKVNRIKLKNDAKVLLFYDLHNP
jgi:hypothetical protein